MPFPWSKSKEAKKKGNSKLESVLQHLGKKGPRSSEDERHSRNSFESYKPPSVSPSTRTPSFAEQHHHPFKGKPLPLPTEVEAKHEAIELDGTTSGYGSGSMSSGSSSTSGEVADVFLDQNGQANFFVLQRNNRNGPHQTRAPPGNKMNSVSPLRTRAAVDKKNMHMNLPARSAPTSVFSSPCHSPRRLSSSEQVLYQTSTHTGRSQGIQCETPEKSPLASPKRVQSGAMSPQSVGHRLPPPPTSSITTTNSSMNTSVFPSSPISSPYNNPVVRWQKGNLLGSGSFGRVYKGFSDSGTFCAMKEVSVVVDDPKSKESVKQLMQEINMLSSLRHRNIVQYLGSEILEDSLYIYLEFVSGGSIQKVLQEYGAFKEPVIRSYTNQILSGISYLHTMNKVHRDIKGANILVDTNGEVKLADFGMAKHISSNSLVLSFKGSPYWMAPEVFKSNNASYPVDIWSLGCTIIEMATGKPPWSQYEGIAAMFKIGNSKEIPYIPDTLSPVAQDFIRQCLQRNPEDRPTAARLLEHPFVKFSNDEQLSDGLPPASPTFRSVVANLSHGGQYHTSRTLSPIGSPSVQSRSIYSSYGGLTPVITSGTSTPRTSNYEELANSPRVLQGFTQNKERINRVSGIFSESTRSEVRYSVNAPGSRSPIAQRSDFVWNPPSPRFYGAPDRYTSPLRNTDK